MVSAIVKTIDDYTFGFRKTTEEIVEAAHDHDFGTVVYGSLVNGEGVTALFHHVLSLIKYLSTCGYLIETEIKKIPGAFAKLSAGLTFAKVFAGLSVVAYSLATIKEALSVVRQQLFHSIFKHHAYKGKGLAYALGKIHDYKEPALKKILPEWLHSELQRRGGKEYLASLITKINAEDQMAFKEGTILLEKIRTYNLKKQIVNILGLTAAVLGLIGSLGIFIAFPPAIIGLLIYASLIFTIAQLILNKGMVENPDGGFSLIKCLPEFIQRKITEKKNPNPYGLLPKVNSTLCGPVLFNYA